MVDNSNSKLLFLEQTVYINKFDDLQIVLLATKMCRWVEGVSCTVSPMSSLICTTNSSIKIIHLSSGSTFNSVLMKWEVLLEARWKTHCHKLTWLISTTTHLSPTHMWQMKTNLVSLLSIRKYKFSSDKSTNNGSQCSFNNRNRTHRWR